MYVTVLNKACVHARSITAAGAWDSMHAHCTYDAMHAIH